MLFFDYKPSFFTAWIQH